MPMVSFYAIYTLIANNIIPIPMNWTLSWAIFKAQNLAVYQSTIFQCLGDFRYEDKIKDSGEAILSL